MRGFSDAFIVAHQSAFDEFSRLCLQASERLTEGKQSEDQYEMIGKFYRLLKARSNEELTARQAEALDGCLRSLNLGAYLPSNQAIVNIADENLMIYGDGNVMAYTPSSQMIYD